VGTTVENGNATRGRTTKVGKPKRDDVLVPKKTNRGKVRDTKGGGSAARVPATRKKVEHRLVTERGENVNAFFKTCLNPG